MPVNPFSIPLPQPTNFEVSQEAVNTSIPDNLYLNQGNITPQITTFIARVNNPDPSPNPINTAGIPGANFIGGDEASPIFYQGEDVVYDVYLYINNQAVDLTRYNLQAVVKASQFSLITTWAGTLGSGIYKDDNVPAHFVIFIPAATLAKTIAGTFELDVLAIEKVNKLNDVRPRTLLVGKTYFEFEYAAFSPNPESLQPGANNRCNLPSTAPPFSINS